MKKMIIENEDNKNRNCLKAIGNDCHRILNSTMNFREYVLFEIIQHWNSFVGDLISKNSKPKDIIFKTEDFTSATLHIIVSSGSFATEVSSNQITIISKINSFFAKNIISEIKIMQGFNLKK